MQVTVYSKYDCVQCDMTKKLMDREGIAYTEINIEEDVQALAMIKAMGYAAAPVVMTDKEDWSGFKAEKIKALKAQH